MLLFWFCTLSVTRTVDFSRVLNVHAPVSTRLTTNWRKLYTVGRGGCQDEYIRNENIFANFSFNYRFSQRLTRRLFVAFLRNLYSFKFLRDCEKEFFCPSSSSGDGCLTPTIKCWDQQSSTPNRRSWHARAPQYEISRDMRDLLLCPDRDQYTVAFGI